MVLIRQQSCGCCLTHIPVVSEYTLVQSYNFCDTNLFDRNTAKNRELNMDIGLHLANDVSPREQIWATPVWDVVRMLSKLYDMVYLFTYFFK